MKNLFANEAGVLFSFLLYPLEADDLIFRYIQDLLGYKRKKENLGAGCDSHFPLSDA
jgi:hypothetical protein